MARIKYYDENTKSWRYADTKGDVTYTLPIASESTLGGVKPVANSEDMTQSVGIDENGLLWTVPQKEAVLYTPQTLTPEQQAQARENIGAVGVSDLPGAETGGLTIAQVNALNELFRAAAYTKDVSDEYATFRKVFGLESSDEPVDPDEPDVPVVTTYNITNNLTGVINSNSATTINEGDAYTATLTVEDDYILNSLVITMGGVDITADVYGEGYILITNVSGDIVITAVAEKLVLIETVVNKPSTLRLIDETGTQMNDALSVINTYISKRVTDESVDIVVKMTNNTDAAQSADLFVAAVGTSIMEIGIVGHPIAYHAKKLVSKFALAPGASYTATYTVPAGNHAVATSNNNNVSIEMFGNLITSDPVNDYTLSNGVKGTYTMYSGTEVSDTSIWSGSLTPYITDVFEQETKIKFQLFNSTGETVYIWSGGFYGYIADGGTDIFCTTKYINNIVLYPGAEYEAILTIPAGCRFATSINNSCVFIEKISE